jgi:hypothetical protein
MRQAWERVRCWLVEVPIWAILLFGLALRLIRIQSRDLQYDDAFSIFLSGRSLPEIVSGTAADTMPPLFYFLLHFWMLVSREVWFLRMLTVLFSLLTIALLYWTVRLWLGPLEAAWGALLAAISPLQMYHAQDIRMYALVVLGQMGYAYFFTRIYFAGLQARREKWFDWLGLVLCGLAAMYSHNLAVFGLAAANLFLIAARRWRLLFRLVAAQLVIGLGAAPWLVMLPGQLEKIQRAFWTPRPGLVEVIQAVILFTANLPLPPVLLVIAAVLSVQGLILVILEVARARGRPQGVLFLACLALVPPLLLFLVSYLMRPVFVTRAFLVSSLAYYALAGFAIVRSWSRGAGKLTGFTFLLVMALSLPSFYTYNEFPRSPARAAIGYLRERVQPGDRIVHETKLSFFPAHFLAPELPQVFVADEPGSPNDTYAPASQAAMRLFPETDLQSAVGDSRRVYYVTYTRVFEEYLRMGLDGHPAIAWLDQRYDLVDRLVFKDLEIYQYER